MGLAVCAFVFEAHNVLFVGKHAVMLAFSFSLPGNRLSWQEKTPCTLLDSFWKWLRERSENVLPKSSLGAAIHYALERKRALEIFLDGPRIPMDNNQSDRDLRHVVIGRKNWNFAGPYEGAERLATFFTLMQSCKRVKLKPLLYLAHVFSVIEDYSIHRLDELTPARVKAAFQASAPAPALST